MGVSDPPVMNIAPEGNTNFGCLKLVGVFHALQNLILVNVDRTVISEVQHFWIVSNLYHYYLRLLIDFASHS